MPALWSHAVSFFASFNFFKNEILYAFSKNMVVIVECEY